MNWKERVESWGHERPKKKKKRKKPETDEERNNRKYKEFLMAEIRTLYAQRSFNVGMCALVIAVLSFVIGVTTLLWVTGTIGQ